MKNFLSFLSEDVNKRPSIYLNNLFSSNLNHDSKDVRGLIAEHPEHAGKLINDPDPYVRWEVARHPEHAGKLVDDPSWRVRKQVAQHPEHAGKLVNDPDPYIRNQAKKTLSMKRNKK